MKLKNNFYFYFSIASLLFNVLLIYFIYKHEYNFSINFNTIFTVLGTLFGAYFGAMIAGKYAVKSVETQIESQKTREEEREKKILIRCLELYQVRVRPLSKLMIDIYPIIDKPVGHFVNDSDSFRIIKSHLEKEKNILLSVDTSEIVSNQIYICLSLLQDIDNIISWVDRLIDTIKIEDEILYHIYKLNYHDLFEHLQEDIKFLNNELNQLNN